MNYCNQRTTAPLNRTPVLSGQTVCGPVLMLVGGRLTLDRPAPHAIRRAPAPSTSEIGDFGA